MAVVFPDTGKKTALQILLDSGNNPTMHLFQNNHTPAVGDALADYTEGDFSGYATVDISDASAADIDGSDHGFRERLAITFTRAAGATSNTIYGWYLTIDNPGVGAELFMAEKFSAPQLMATAGDQIKFDFTLFDELGV